MASPLLGYKGDYIILNSKLQRIGTLSNIHPGGTPFYNDVISNQIADNNATFDLNSVQDNLNKADPNANSKNWGHVLESIYIPYGYPDTDKIAQGNSLAYQDPDTQHWYVMRLTNVTDQVDPSGQHIKEASGVNLCIWKLGKTVHRPTTITHANSREAFGALLSDTGWYLGGQMGDNIIPDDRKNGHNSAGNNVIATIDAIDHREYEIYMHQRNGHAHLEATFDEAGTVLIKKGIQDVLGHVNLVFTAQVTGTVYIHLISDDDSDYSGLAAREISPNAELVGGSHDVSFDGQNSNQNMIQQLCQEYDAELDAYVQFNPMGQIVLKRVDVKRRLGADNGSRVIYSRNATNIQRNIVDDSLYTKLYVYGTDGSTCDCKSSNYRPYVVDDVANHIYNPPIDNGSSPYLEGAIVSQTMKNPEALYQWGINQLKLFNHPRANYTVTVSSDFDAGLGDTVKVIDMVMNPQLTVEARVIQKRTSFSNPTQNTLTLGEFTTINVVPPNFIRNLSQSVDNHFDELLQELRNDPSALTCTVDKPDGTSWRQGEAVKHFTAHIYILGEDISAMIQPQGYVWERFDKGAEDFDFKDTHKMSGQRLELDDGLTGEIRLSIDTSYITDTSEIDFDTSQVSQVFTVDHWHDAWGDDRVGALQYVNYNPNDGCYYASLVYYGSKRPRKNGGSGHLIHRLSHSEIARLDSNGNLLDSMILLFSQHNSNFGLQNDGGQTYIWTTFEDYNNNQQSHKADYCLARIPYRSNTVVQPGDPSYQTVKTYSEPFCMANYDNSSGMVVFSHDYTNSNPEHTVEIYKADDLINQKNKAEPLYQFNLTDFGFNPKASNGSQDLSSQQTFQSGCLHFPYYIFTSGNINMTDKRMVYGINIKNHTLVFKRNLELSDFNLGDYVFAEPETLNWMQDTDGSLKFLFGLNTATYDHKADDKSSADNQGLTYNSLGFLQPDYEHVEKLFKVGFDMRSNKDINPSGGNIDVNS